MVKQGKLPPDSAIDVLFLNLGLTVKVTGNLIFNRVTPVIFCNLRRNEIKKNFLKF